MLAARLRIGQASVGLEFLLPALVGAFLGSTTIKPGRVNVWGTIVGVIILAVGISGIQQFGGAFWVEPMFNGVTLLIAIGFAGWTGRRRGRAVVRVTAPEPHEARPTEAANTGRAERCDGHRPADGQSRWRSLAALPAVAAAADAFSPRPRPR